MTQYNRQNERDCHPAPVTPADQPKKPKNADCPTSFSDPDAPAIPGVPDCPPSDCNCPVPPTSKPECLEGLIRTQTNSIAAADKAKAFKADLEALLGKAKTATAEYTQERYDKLKKLWLEQDVAIAELIRKLVCAVPCWHCIIECYVCPLLETMRKAEGELHGDDMPPSDLHNQYDLVYWYTRERDRKERRFNRIKAVLGAWEKPANTIEKVLTDNAKLIVEAGTSLGSSATKAVFDVLVRIVPMHLAIAPPAASPELTTKIGKEFTQLCGCDVGYPEDCCGPDIGIPSLRQRLFPPQAYLIEPGQYYDVICCLVESWYVKAKDALATAEGDLAEAESKLKTLKSQIENGLRSFEKDARAGIPVEVDCCGFEKDGGASTAS